MFFRKFGLLFQDVILVGCGGTGSRVVAPLIQTIKQAQAQLNPQLWLVDGDIFEHKNLTRQNCIERDIGRNKAVVMAERYGTALDFPVVAVPHMMVDKRYDNHGMFGRCSHDQGRRGMLSTRRLWILCVDSVEARLNILKTASPKDIIIDAGNEDTFGQVSIFDNVSLPHARTEMSPQPTDMKPFSGEYELPFIPSVVYSYLNAKHNPSPATGSCADLDQSLAINNLMAAGIVNMVQNLAYNNPFYCRTNYFDLIKGNNSERMSVNWFNEEFNRTCPYPEEGIKNNSDEFLHAYANQCGYRYCSREDSIKRLVDEIKSKVKFIDPALLAALGK